MKTQLAKSLLSAALIGGLAGWTLENVLALAKSEPERFSHLFQKASVPFLPVYAAGGAMIEALSPFLKNEKLASRAVVYAASLTALELIACKLDRIAGDASWSYAPSGDSSSLEGCVDLPHGLAWGGLGLLAERFLPRVVGARKK